MTGIFALRFMVMAVASKENTCKKTGVSATRDVGDAIACAAMHVLLLCAAFESCRSSVSLAVAFAGIYFSFRACRVVKKMIYLSLSLLYKVATQIFCPAHWAWHWGKNED